MMQGMQGKHVKTRSGIGWTLLRILGVMVIMALEVVAAFILLALLVYIALELM
jgi:hypothetical protein